jgi:integrase
MFDGQGLHLYVTLTGYKSWRLKYRYEGKEKRIVFGPYPEVSLREARDMREAARRLLREGVDPGEEHKRKSLLRTSATDPDSTFRAIATRWHELQAPLWKDRHAHDVLASLEGEVFPIIGAKRLTSIKPVDIRKLLETVQNRGAVETAHRIRQRISAVYRFAIASDLAEIDPAAAIGAALKPVVRGKQPALLKIAEARAFLLAYEREPGHPTTKLASRLLALTAARPGMVQLAEIGEFEGLEGDSPIWRVPAVKMKLGKLKSEQTSFEFIVPLSTQAAETVRAAAGYARKSKYLFPSARHSHRPISDNALNVAYRRVAGFEGQHVPHGWRASFSTIMNELAIDNDRPGDRAIIDLMLAHEPSGVEARYNRAAYMPRRRKIAQEWADMLAKDAPPPSELLLLPRR